MVALIRDRRRTVYLRSISALLLLVSAATLGTISPVAAEVLSNEDVVRLVVTGVPTEEILETIRTSEVDFDLSEEMLDELRIAGVPPEILGAMQARAAPETPPETPEDPIPAGKAKLTLLLGASTTEGESPRLKMLDPISPAAAENLGLASDERHFSDLALFVICRTADHVPDHWRGKSPLGRDFRSMPRHEMLAFVAGAEHLEAGALQAIASRLTKVAGAQEEAQEAGALRLDLPATIELELTPFIAHDLSIGVAARAAARYYALMIDGRDGVILEESSIEMRIELDSGDGSPAQVSARFAVP